MFSDHASGNIALPYSLVPVCAKQLCSIAAGSVFYPDLQKHLVPDFVPNFVPGSSVGYVFTML